MRGYRAVIFDLYYTLLYDAGTGTREKAIALAEASGISQADWLGAWRATADAAQAGELPTMRARVRQAMDNAGLDGSDERLADELTGLLLARQIPRLYPDVRGTLAELQGRGYRLGLVSNLHGNESPWIREYELDEHFDAIVLSHEAGMMKPEPRIYLMAAERLSARPEECVFVDDMPSYVAGAKRVGMTGVRINRFGSDERYEEFGEPEAEADLRIRNLRELLDWLPEQGGESGTEADAR